MVFHTKKPFKSIDSYRTKDEWGTKKMVPFDEVNDEEKIKCHWATIERQFGTKKKKKITKDCNFGAYNSECMFRKRLYVIQGAKKRRRNEEKATWTQRMHTQFIYINIKNQMIHICALCNGDRRSLFHFIQRCILFLAVGSSVVCDLRYIWQFSRKNTERMENLYISQCLISIISSLSCFVLRNIFPTTKKNVYISFDYCL